MARGSSLPPPRSRIRRHWDAVTPQPAELGSENGRRPEGQDGHAQDCVIAEREHASTGLHVAVTRTSNESRRPKSSGRSGRLHNARATTAHAPSRRREKSPTTTSSYMCGVVTPAAVCPAAQQLTSCGAASNSCASTAIKVTEDENDNGDTVDTCWDDDGDDDGNSTLPTYDSSTRSRYESNSASGRQQLVACASSFGGCDSGGSIFSDGRSSRQEQSRHGGGLSPNHSASSRLRSILSGTGSIVGRSEFTTVVCGGGECAAANAEPTCMTATTTYGSAGESARRSFGPISRIRAAEATGTATATRVSNGRREKDPTAVRRIDDAAADAEAEAGAEGMAVPNFDGAAAAVATSASTPAPSHRQLLSPAEAASGPNNNLSRPPRRQHTQSSTRCTPTMLEAMRSGSRSLMENKQEHSLNMNSPLARRRENGSHTFTDSGAATSRMVSFNIFLIYWR